MCNEGIEWVITRNWFREILQNLYFVDKSKAPAYGQNGYDHLFKVRPVLNKVLKNSQRVNLPGENLSVDEGMIAFKGRLRFRQYMPTKQQSTALKCGWLLILKIASL